MREIKYRVWCGENGMCAVEEIWFGKRKIIVSWKGYSNTYDFDDVPLMQFTGLHDKNGKEIYEGDIVRLSGDDVNVQVVFEDGGFFCRDGSNSWGLLTNNETEVIGNIHETPELLGL